MAIILDEVFIVNIVLSVLYGIAALFACHLFVRLCIYSNMRAQIRLNSLLEEQRQYYFNNTSINEGGSIQAPPTASTSLLPPSASTIPSLPPTSPSTNWDTKIMLVLIVIQALVRIIQFLLVSFVNALRYYRSLLFLVVSLPSLLWTSTAIFLIFLLAEFYHNISSTVKNRIVVVLTSLIYLIMLLIDVGLFWDFYKNELKEPPSEKLLNNKYSIFQIIQTSYTSLLFLLCAVGFLVYGIALMRKFSRMTVSTPIYKTIIKIIVISIVCALSFVSRAVILLTSIFFEPLVHKWYISLVYFLVFELLPLLPILYVLYTLTHQQGVIVSKLVDNMNSRRLSVTERTPRILGGNHVTTTSEKRRSRASSFTSLDITGRKKQGAGAKENGFPSMIQYNPEHHAFYTSQDYSSLTGSSVITNSNTQAYMQQTKGTSKENLQEDEDEDEEEEQKSEDEKPANGNQQNNEEEEENEEDEDDPEESPTRQLQMQFRKSMQQQSSPSSLYQ